MNRTKKRTNEKSREQVCGIFYQQQLARKPSRTDRNGYLFKMTWLTRKQTTWLIKAKPENGDAFKPIACGRQWHGMFVCGEKVVWARVTVARNGASLMRVTECSVPTFERASRLVKALKIEMCHEVLFSIALTALSSDCMAALEEVVNRVKDLRKKPVSF